MVTSRFTKIFYCEGANIAHIQSGNSTSCCYIRTVRCYPAIRLISISGRVGKCSLLDTDFTGYNDDIGDKPKHILTLSQCVFECLDTSECVAVTYVERCPFGDCKPMGCWLKKAMDGEEPAANRTSVKMSCVCNPGI